MNLSLEYLGVRLHSPKFKLEKQLELKWGRHLRTSGVYVIVCVPENRFYIGASQDVYKRWITHKGKLNQGTHSNKVLQGLWNEYGPSGFYFSLLQFCHIQQLVLTERVYERSIPSKQLINVSTRKTGSGTLGKKRSKESREKISNALRGIKRSDETRSRISNSRKGAESNRKGIKMTEEQRAHLAKTRRENRLKKLQNL